MGLPLLAHANLLAETFERVDDNDDPSDVAGFIEEMAELVETLSVEDVAREINEDRAVAGFPKVKLEDVESQLATRKRYFKDSIKDALNRMSPADLVEALTLAVDRATSEGHQHAPQLIDELVDSYEVEAQGFLQAEGENVHRLIEAAREAAARGETAVSPIVGRLGALVRNWDRVAQPIQLSAKARGLDHDASNEIAYAVRSLAVDLFNEQGMLEQAKRLAVLLGEVFAEVPEVSERVAEDSNALREIAASQREAEAQRAEWERELAYSVDLGTIRKSVLAISPDGVWWRGTYYPLDAVTRVRWGAVRRTVNGIPAGTTFTIAFGDDISEAVAEFKQEAVFGEFVERLWRSVGVRLLVELLTVLRSGQEVRFGDAIVRDDSIILTKRKFLAANEQQPCSWNDVQVWTADGSFYVGSKHDRKTYVDLSYIHSSNVHVLEHAIRTAFKTPGLNRLSDLLG
ncbi:MAG: hypothetical protein ACREX3_17170 [Gammaproteobacteria bacterium]